MKKHTEGPWTLTHIAGGNFAVQRFEIRGKFGDKENVYPIFNKDTYAIDGSTICCSPQDAYLIAAAPDLLAALKALLDKSCEQDDCTASAYRTAAEEARTALAKAEGAPPLTFTETAP